MPDYYVPKKNRCPCADCCNGGTSIYPNTYKCRNSSLHMRDTDAKTVYAVDKTIEGKGYKQVGKSDGNRKKMGSGGNSYAAYLAKRVGKQLCNC